MLKNYLAVPVAAAVLLLAGGAHAQAGKSLAGCQKTVGKEIASYSNDYQSVVGKCLKQVTKAVVQEQDATPPGAVSDAAGKCFKAFLKLENTAKPTKTLTGKLSGKIGAACDPDHPAQKATHPEVDVLGPNAGSVLDEPLDAEALGTWCTNFGGDGSIGDFDEWSACLTDAATCGARQTLATTYPRLLEWLAALEPEIAGMDTNCGGSCAGGCTDQAVIDACAALTALDAAVEGPTDDGEPEIACGPPSAGNGVLDEGEVCDGTDFGGLTCNTYAPSGSGWQDPAAGNGLTCVGGRIDISGCVVGGTPNRFNNNNNGTFTDLATKLMWETKDDGTGVSDKDNTYLWSTTPTERDGPLFTVFLDALNNTCDDDETTLCISDADCVGAPNTFANNDLCGHGGHRDWRIPTHLELRTLLGSQLWATDPCASPCVDPSLPGEVPVTTHTWSISQHTLESFAHEVRFDTGQFTNFDETTVFPKHGWAVRSNP